MWEGKSIGKNPKFALTNKQEASAGKSTTGPENPALNLLPYLCLRAVPQLLSRNEDKRLLN